RIAVLGWTANVRIYPSLTVSDRSRRRVVWVFTAASPTIGFWLISQREAKQHEHHRRDEQQRRNAQIAVSGNALGVDEECERVLVVFQRDGDRHRDAHQRFTC